MALVFFSGFETGDFAEWPSVTGSPSVVEADGWGAPKTGIYAMRCNTSNATAFAIHLDSADGGRATFYLYIVDAPSANCIILGGPGGVQVYLTTTRYLALYYGGGEEDVGDTQLSLNTWYRISLGCNDAGHDATLYLNGSEECVITDHANITVFYRQLGVGTSVTADLYFDDYAYDDTDAITDLGDIRVAAASPNAVGTYAQYDSVSGYTNVDEIPASDVDYIEDNGADVARESYNIPNLADLAGANSGDTINAVSVWIRGDADGGGATDHKAMVRDNGSDYESSALGFDSIAWFNWYLAVMPDDSAAWLEARFNSLQIGAYHSGGQDQRIHCLVAMVAYTPAVAPEEEGGAQYLVMGAEIKTGGAQNIMIGFP